MKLHKYADDPLVKRLTKLSDQATPGPWKADPKRLVMHSMGKEIQGPVMSYLVGDQTTGEGSTVSLASERHADHHLVAELVNAWREGRLYAILED